MAKAQVIYLDGRYPYPAAAAHAPGDLVVRPDGTYAIYDDLDSCASGQRVSPQPINTSQVVKFEKAAASDNLAAAAVVYIVPASGKITATSTDNVRVGKLIQAAGTGVTHALVNTGA